MSTDVVNLSHSTLMQNQVDGFTMIFNIKPISYIKAFSIHWQWLIIQSIYNH